jgi:hypothetical protein
VTTCELSDSAPIEALDTNLQGATLRPTLLVVAARLRESFLRNRASGVIAEVLDLSVLAHAHSATSAAKGAGRIGGSPEEEAAIPRHVVRVLAHGAERVLRVLAAPLRALTAGFLDRRERAFRVMRDQTIERLFRRQAFVSVNRDGRVADGESFADVGFWPRSAYRRLYGVLIRIHRMAESVLIAADEEVGLHIGSFPEKSTAG